MTETKTEAPKPIEIDLPPAEGGAAVVVRENGNGRHIAPHRSGAASILELVRDPSTDVARLKELMIMYRELAAEEARLDYGSAMSDAQSEMKPVIAELVNKAANNNKYPSQVAVDDAIRPIYTKYGFFVDFDTADTPLPEHVRLVCTISHRSGHHKVRRLDISADGTGPKGGAVMSKAHAEVSAVTLGKRTLLGMVFNLAINKDDDGNAAGAATETDKPKLSPQQIAELGKLIESTGGNIEKFCKFAKIAKLGDIFADKYGDAVAAVNNAAKARKTKKT